MRGFPLKFRLVIQFILRTCVLTVEYLTLMSIFCLQDDDKQFPFPYIIEGISSAYSSTSSMLMFSQALMMLEILHSAFGLVKSGIVTVFLQVCTGYLYLCGNMLLQICNKLPASVPVLFKC